MQDILDQLLIKKNIAYAVFDSSLNKIIESKNLPAILPIEQSKLNKTIYELIPEFFGLEKEIENILSCKLGELHLDKVNRYDKKGNLIYLDFLAIPLDNSILIIVTNSTLNANLEQKIQQQKNEINILKESISFYKKDVLNNILGKSAEIESIKKFIKKIANIKETTILLTGESGTGKTLVAKGIHSYSKYSDKPFVEINCATIPSALLESELFGHVKGAFTSATENKKGLLEEADGGTLFLDEIGELPLTVQPKFLSFLESKKFRQVGSTKEISVNVRIITATNKDLQKAVQEKEFREDLYYRINVVSLKIPSLRERSEDIIIIAQKFIELFSQNFNKSGIVITENAKQKLLNYSWPGNIRELKNCIERAMIFCEENTIDSDDLLIYAGDYKNNTKDEKILPDEGISLLEIEKTYLESAIKKANGNQSKAAKLLNLSLDTFRYRIKKHNLTI